MSTSPTLPTLLPEKALDFMRLFPNLETLEARRYAYALTVYEAKFICKEARGDIATVNFLLSVADDMKIPWSLALRQFYTTPDGKLGIDGSVASAVLLGQGFKIKQKEWTEERCILTMSRPDGSMQEDFEFSLAEASAINIWAKDKWIKLSEKFNWRSYRKDMLYWRALMRGARRIAADVLGGVYLKDEIEDTSPPDEPSTEVATTPSFAVGRKSAAKEPEAAEPEAAQKALPEAPAPITLPKQKGREGVPLNVSDQMGGSIIAEAAVAGARGDYPAAAPVAAPTPTPEPKPEPAAEAKPAKAEPKPLDEESMALMTRLNAVKETIGGSATVAQGAINSFFREWFGIDAKDKERMKDRKAWKEVLPIIEALLQANPKAFPTKQMPQLVEFCRKNFLPKDSLDKLAERYGWSDVTMKLCRDVQRVTGNSTDDMLVWLFGSADSGGLDLAKRLDDDIQAFFDVYLVTAEAVRLWPISDGMGHSLKTIADIMRNELKGSFQDAGEKRVVAAIEKMETLLREAKGSEPEEESGDSVPGFLFN